MTYDINDFLPFYPLLNEHLQDTITNKKEFYDLVQKQITPGEVSLKHQKIIARFLSTHTPYNSLLLFHEMGTGKTCASVETIEQILSAPNTPYKRAYILAPRKTLLDQYKAQVMYTCMPHKYKNMRQYTFLTFYQAAKRFKQDLSLNKIQDYNHSIFVIDEVHNLRNAPDNSTKHIFNLDQPPPQKIYKTFDRIEFITKKENYSINIDDKRISFKKITRGKLTLHSFITPPIDTPQKTFTIYENDTPTNININTITPYNIIKTFIRSIQYKKTILMTGTPMKNNPAEIIDILNLLNTTDIKESSNDIIHNIDQLKPYLYGKISYLKSNFPIHVVYNTHNSIRGPSPDLSLFLPMYYIDMKNIQSRQYNTEIARKGDSPDWKDVTLSKLALSATSNITELSRNTSEYSCKFNELLRLLKTIQPPYNRHFVYCDFVEDGINLLKRLIQHKLPNTTIITLTGSQKNTSIKKDIDSFNQNTKFNKTIVILGSRVISEGITLKNISHVHILTSHWNMSVIDQAIARAIRHNSHPLLKTNNPAVNVYLYCAISKDIPIENNIDVRKYTRAYEKDKQIKSIELFLKKIAFDCNLHRKHNKEHSSHNNTRRCQYTTCDQPCFNPVKQKILDKNTYNLYYSQLYYDHYKKYIEMIFTNNISVTFKQLFDTMEYNTHTILSRAIDDTRSSSPSRSRKSRSSSPSRSRKSRSSSPSRSRKSRSSSPSRSRKSRSSSPSRSRKSHTPYIDDPSSDTESPTTTWNVKKPFIKINSTQQKHINKIVHNIYQEGSDINEYSLLNVLKYIIHNKIILHINNIPYFLHETTGLYYIAPVHVFNPTPIESLNKQPIIHNFNDDIYNCSITETAASAKTIRLSTTRINELKKIAASKPYPMYGIFIGVPINPGETPDEYISANNISFNLHAGTMKPKQITICSRASLIQYNPNPPGEMGDISNQSLATSPSKENYLYGNLFLSELRQPTDTPQRKGKGKSKDAGKLIHSINKTEQIRILSDIKLKTPDDLPEIPTKKDIATLQIANYLLQHNLLEIIQLT